jgi:hypothetical protein
MHFRLDCPFKNVIAWQVNHLVQTNMEKGMINYKANDHEGVTQTWDIMQENVSSLLRIVHDINNPIERCENVMIWLLLFSAFIFYFLNVMTSLS